jgi:hypothetical protein
VHPPLPFAVPISQQTHLKNPAILRVAHRLVPCRSCCSSRRSCMSVNEQGHEWCGRFLMFRKSTRRRHTITDASSTQRNDQRPSCVSLQIQHGNFRKVDICADDIISCAITGNSKMTMNIHQVSWCVPQEFKTRRCHMIWAVTPSHLVHAHHPCKTNGSTGRSLTQTSRSW